MQEDKSGTLGTGNDQTIFCLQGNGIDRADTAGCNGKGWREDTSYTLNTIDRPAVIAFAQNQREEVRTVGDKAVSLAAEGGMHCQTFVALDMSHACAYREDAETHPVQNMVVRRLTPMECERLQGFPDHWTDIGEWIDEKGKKHKDADSPRYKALGNSIALPFWGWMLRRMAQYLPEHATLGSLFDGIGGFPLCWEKIHGDHTARWASEIEEFPMAVTKKHFPEKEEGDT